MERSPAQCITQLFATFICLCWIVVLVTTRDTFHNGLKQSLWKQSFWFAINNPPPGSCVCFVNRIKKIFFKWKHRKFDALLYLSLHTFCVCLVFFGTFLAHILTMIGAVTDVEPLVLVLNISHQFTCPEFAKTFSKWKIIKCVFKWLVIYICHIYFLQGSSMTQLSQHFRMLGLLQYQCRYLGFRFMPILNTDTAPVYINKLCFSLWGKDWKSFFYLSSSIRLKLNFFSNFTKQM